ncbi:MAG: GIY-YIG nuclease family protein [Parcubacteria group bacterium]|nr:GIY-YIG nuclease family protein [Parcubacteria group bacterium]
MFCVYVLKSSKTGKYYIGQTNNLSERFNSHNKGKNASTKTGVPWNLAASKEFATRIEPMKV